MVTVHHAERLWVGRLPGGSARTTVILVILALALTGCSSGGHVHVYHIPSPTPHKVVLIR